MDSVTLLHEYAERIALAITFVYGSNHNAREAECAALHCRQCGIRHIILPLQFMKEHFTSALLSGADKIPEGRYDGQNMASTVVPLRNGIMLTIAAGIAESNGLRHVMIANHSGDHTIYADCRPGFIDAISQAISLGTDTHVTVIAPYTGITKADIARHGKTLGLDYATTYSCYKGRERHCGRCGTCIERREALAEAGIADTTIYDG